MWVLLTDGDHTYLNARALGHPSWPGVCVLAEDDDDSSALRRQSSLVYSLWALWTDRVQCLQELGPETGSHINDDVSPLPLL